MTNPQIVYIKLIKPGDRGRKNLPPKFDYRPVSLLGYQYHTSKINFLEDPKYDTWLAAEITFFIPGTVAPAEFGIYECELVALGRKVPP